MKTRGVTLPVLVILLSSGAALADALIVSSVNSNGGTQSLSVTNTNGLATAMVNGVPVTLPYSQNGTTIRIINGFGLLPLQSPQVNALRAWQQNYAKELGLFR
jgi:hypothetical protein